MKIRSKLSLWSTGLVVALVLALAATVTSVQRSALQEQSRRRLQALGDGVSRIAVEAVENRDQLMLLSYLMHLRKEHPELAFAAVTSRGHTSTLGSDRPGLVYWGGRAASRRPVTYTVSTISGAGPGADASLSVSTSGVRLQTSDNARVTVTDPGGPAAVDFKLGFDAAALEAETARALEPLTRRTAAIAGAFMLLGWLGALGMSQLLTGPLTALASAVSAVKAGNLDVAVATAGSDELRLLASRFNEMTVHLKELMQSREDLLHTLTHELNTPLGGLKGYLELWQERKLPEGPARDEALRIMSAAVIRMEHSLGNALGLFRSGAAARSAAKGVVWIDELLREACVLFAPEAAAKRIALRSPPESVRAFLYADVELLRQVVVNLVSNALKYTPEGGRVQLGLDGNERVVRLWVADNGCGIAPEDLPHLFTKFYRATAGAERRRVKGTGLGLSIAQKAAAALGGEITVSSRVGPGSGSVFSVIFPRSAKSLEAS